MVITATKVATPPGSSAPRSGRARRRRAEVHYETVEDVLRNVPGVEIQRSGSIGKVSNISIRGANANQVQVLVDGVRVKSPTLGQADLSDISPT